MSYPIIRLFGVHRGRMMVYPKGQLVLEEGKVLGQVELVLGTEALQVDLQDGVALCVDRLHEPPKSSN